MSGSFSPPWGASAEDTELLERVGGVADGAEVSDDWLREIALTKGVDFATAALYRFLRTRSVHRGFIERVETHETLGSRGDSPRLIVMPGAFYIRHPETGGGGERVLKMAAELGWTAERVAVRDLGTIAENAAALVRTLAQGRGRPAIVVSLSKGGADVRGALMRAGASEELCDVRSWVSLSGMTLGTPLIGWLRSRRLRCWGVRLMLRLRGQRFATLEEISHDSKSGVGAPFVLPDDMRAIHVLGFPLQRHLSRDWSRRAHARLAGLGPNDGGGVLLSDALRLPGDVYPVWGADHYLEPGWDVRGLLLRVLKEAAK